MSETRKLVLVIESTAAMGPHWRTIFSDYLEKIIRSFCGDEHTKASTSIAELTLVNFNARESSICLAQRKNWTTDVDVLMEWLSALNFSGGDFCDGAIAEGLAEVLMMFPSVKGIKNPQRHCILVAASNPYPKPTPVYIPPDYLGIRSENHLSDAVTVAEYFKQCMISLSVICPTELPKLKAIYNAAKRNPSSIDPTIDIPKKPDYLVLISESFLQARAALSKPEITDLPSNQSPIIIDLTQPSSPDSDLSPNNSPATLKESITVSYSIASESNQTFSPLTWEDITSWYENEQNSTPEPVVPATIPEKPTRGITSFLNTLAQSRRNPNLSKILTGGMTSSLPVTSSGQLAESATVPGTSPSTNLVNANVATNVGPTPGISSPLNSEPSKYIVELWEGDLTIEKEGQCVLITKLQAYRNAKDSESLAKDWPLRMKIDRLLPEDDIKNQIINLSGNVDYLVFTAINEHFFLNRVQERRLCMIIKLPSQSLMLAVSADKTSTLVGRLLPQEMVRYWD